MVIWDILSFSTLNSVKFWVFVKKYWYCEMWDYNIVWNISWYSFKVPFQPSIVLLQLYPLVGLQSGWTLSQLPSGKRRNTPWISCQLFVLTWSKNNNPHSHSNLRPNSSCQFTFYQRHVFGLWEEATEQTKADGQKTWKLQRNPKTRFLCMHFSAALKEQKKQKVLVLSFTGIVNKQNGYNLYPQTGSSPSLYPQ